MDKVLHNIRNTFACIDDILIVTEETKQQHMTKVEKVLKVLDEAGIRLNFKKIQNCPMKKALVRKNTN